MIPGSWQAIAERAAEARCATILAKIRAAITEHAPDALVDQEAGRLRVRGRVLKRRWITDAGLRFARRIAR